MSALPVPKNWEKLRTTYWFGVPIDFVRHKRTRLLAAVSAQIPDLFVQGRTEYALDRKCFRELKSRGFQNEYETGRVWTNGQGRAEP